MAEAGRPNDRAGRAADTVALLPRTPAVFVARTLAYAVALGACYAACSAVVLEAIGREAAATWDGRLHDWRGPAGMLAGEVLFCVAGVVLFALLVAVTRPRARR